MSFALDWTTGIRLSLANEDSLRGAMTIRCKPGLTSTALLAAAVTAMLTACGTIPTEAPPRQPSKPSTQDSARTDYFVLDGQLHPREVVIFALGLLDTGYRFGGRNPDAGLDCSGMVSYVVEQVSGRKLPHNAAKIAEITRPIDTTSAQPGDLVFFNTANRRHSHMGIYMGEGRFVHAPSSGGRVRIERLDNPYFAPRLDGVRTLISPS